MSPDDRQDELQRLRERQYAIGEDLHHVGLQYTELKGRVDYLSERIRQLVTREEFTPVQRVVYGLVAFILGGAVMAMLGLIFRVASVR